MNLRKIGPVLVLVMIVFAFARAEAAGKKIRICTAKNWQETESHVINGVTSAMTINMVTTRKCATYARNFSIAFSGGIIPDTVVMTCKNPVTVKGVVSIAIGKKYTCSWQVSGKGHSKEFEWLDLGSRWQTCSILKTWVEVSVR